MVSSYLPQFDRVQTLVNGTKTTH